MKALRDLSSYLNGNQTRKRADDMTILTKDDLYYFNEGRFFRLYEKLGAHVLPDGRGTHFAVWAPNAKSVNVIGDFNGWNRNAHALKPVESTGIWAGIVPDARQGEAYKYYIVSNSNGYAVEKSDPIAFCTEEPSKTASVISSSVYQWQDDEWMKNRGQWQQLQKPMSVYEVHLGSWRRKVTANRSLSYVELADELVAYVKDMGFTHVEFLPVMEHPFGGSWGYQVTGYFSPSRRYGDPDDFKLLVDKCHQAGIGVILDWVPSHFPSDEHGPAFFDGTYLYEHEDPRLGYHPDWNSHIFNYGRREVRSYLISNALFWLDKYHIDALRVDAVASMLYLDYSRKEGEWVPNIHGGRENLEAISFMRELNEEVYKAFPDVHMIAEESTAWGGVSRPTSVGGLGFGMKWDMGWMHDTLQYFKRDSIHRRHHQNEITFRSLYAFNENFMLALSHDEVVHGKGSMIGKMPGDDWQKFANLRCLYSYMYASPGKKLLFMGNEFAQWDEWNHDTSLDWHLTQYDRHRGMQNVVRDLNRLYREEAALQVDFDSHGFEWIDQTDREKSIICFIRKSADGKEIALCLFNFTPMTYEGYRIGLPQKGQWLEIFNSDAVVYGGSGNVNTGVITAQKQPWHGRAYSGEIKVPPLGAVVLKLKKV